MRVVLVIDMLSHLKIVLACTRSKSVSEVMLTVLLADSITEKTVAGYSLG